MARSEKENGSSLKVPIGFRFTPTDEELLNHYLKRKILCLPLPTAVIPEFQALHFNPWDLPGELKEKRYFFSRRKRNNKCSTDCGYWKSSGKDKQIMSKSFVNIGTKKSYVFYQYQYQGRRKMKTQWVLQEFCLNFNTPLILPHERVVMHMQLPLPVGDWVVCRLYQKKIRRSAKNINKFTEISSAGATHLDDQEASSYRF